MATPFFPEVTAAWVAAQIENNEIPAQKFLEAAQKFVPIFDRLGKVFYPVKADVGGNVDKLVKALAANPSPTLQALINAEKKAGKEKDKASAAIALLWFKRAMEFVFTMLKKVSEGIDGTKAAKESYAETLSKYHGFMVKKTFDMGLMAAPSTETMTKTLGPDQATVIKEMGEWVAVAKPMLENIHAYLTAQGLDDQSKV
mmetsp:Transcript_43498/g.85012  ORF Transcript_43498/g.85012 Transcript_43498/m.85012 type:complete len:200 (-) Transcript_43498:316-915(-)|eukprot:CAMPEP_0173414824 /NCGR_PEP_ID=MMETSP1356-20130122/84533_1 /TAXON_ID=77927 ORGANISM="Hemiselmis virescens, Strain PCC157" /NCGR_SAMPLE_ID=MMETSP1356 /ASSEMBLY_ACC=CAM_ASM_000847 /LENGTH=199 /DNA_ID=CAMNT_0014377027 /DNA_START=21 /DNA_END=620 /DNA_ORIENTATION=-